MYCFTEQSVWGFILLFSLIFLICPLSAFLYIHLQFPPPPLAEEQETRLSSVSWHPKKYKSMRKQHILCCQPTWIHRPALGRHLLPDRVKSHPPEQLGSWPAYNQELIVMWILFDLLSWPCECRTGDCDKCNLLRVKNYWGLVLPAVLMGGWIADFQGLKSDRVVRKPPDVGISEGNSSANLAW